MKYLLIIFLICSQALGALVIGPSEPAQDAVLLNKNQAAPYQGILMPVEKVQEYKNTTVERDGLKQLNDSQNKSIMLLDDMHNKDQNTIKLYSDQNDKLLKAAQSAQSLSTIEKVFYVVLGSAIVVGGAYVSKLSK